MKLSYYYQEQIGCHPIIIAEVEKNYLKKLIWADKLHSNTEVMKSIIQLLSSMHNNSLITSHVFCKLELKTIPFKLSGIFAINDKATDGFLQIITELLKLWSDCCLMWLTFLVFLCLKFFCVQILCLGNFSTYFKCEYLQNQNSYKMMT